jgi:hypothetical protein
MVAVHRGSDGNSVPPAHVGCASCAPLYAIPRSRWTKRLTVQMILYCIFAFGTVVRAQMHGRVQDFHRRLLVLLLLLLLP